MTGTARIGDEEDVAAAALGERLKAWFAALSGRPVPPRLIEHVDSLEEGEPEPAPTPETPAA
jgi:hypothetical protein